MLCRINIRYAMALFKFSKSGRVQSLLHVLKYKNQPELGVMLGNLYGDRMARVNLRDAFEHHSSGCFALLQKKKKRI